MSKQVSRGSAGEYQADEQAVVARFSWRDHHHIAWISQGWDKTRGLEFLVSFQLKQVY